MICCPVSSRKPLRCQVTPAVPVQPRDSGREYSQLAMWRCTTTSAPAAWRPAATAACSGVGGSGPRPWMALPLLRVFCTVITRLVRCGSDRTHGSTWLKRNKLSWPSSTLACSFWLRPNRFFCVYAQLPTTPDSAPSASPRALMPPPALKPPVRFSTTLTSRSSLPGSSGLAVGTRLTSSKMPVPYTASRSRRARRTLYTVPGRVVSARITTSGRVRGDATGSPVSLCSVRTVTRPTTASATLSSQMPLSDRSASTTCPKMPRSSYHELMADSATLKAPKLSVRPYCAPAHAAA